MVNVETITKNLMGFGKLAIIAVFIVILVFSLTGSTAVTSAVSFNFSTIEDGITALVNTVFDYGDLIGLALALSLVIYIVFRNVLGKKGVMNDMAG